MHETTSVLMAFTREFEQLEREPYVSQGKGQKERKTKNQTDRKKGCSQQLGFSFNPTKHDYSK